MKSEKNLTAKFELYDVIRINSRVNDPHILNVFRPSYFHRNRYMPFIFVLSLFTLLACNETFEPMQENDVYFFTFFGYLDAAADTQWVAEDIAEEALKGAVQSGGEQIRDAIKVSV